MSTPATSIPITAGSPSLCVVKPSNFVRHKMSAKGNKISNAPITKLPKKALDVIFRQIHVDFSTYYQVLGPEKIRALSYQKSKLDLECTKLVNNSQVGTDNIKNEFINTFKVDDKHTLSNIKKMVGELYKKLGLNKTPKAVDILDYFEVLKTRAKDDSGRFVAAYKILKIKEDLNG